MVNPACETINIDYDPDIYRDIIETGRLVKFDDNLRDLSFSNPTYLQSIENKKIGKDFIFTSKYRFDTSDLTKILKVHVPLEANAFKEKCKNNILTIKFYKLPED